MKITNFKYFYPERPRLLGRDQELFQQLSLNPNWIAEKKYNGSRLQLHFYNGDFQFWNRRGTKLTYKPNDEVKEALHSLPLRGYCLFDGELRHNKTKGIQHRIVLFDTFIWQGELLDWPFQLRRKILEEICPMKDPVKIIEQFSSRFEQLLEQFTKEPEIEGLVIKNKKGILNLGRRSPINSRWMYKARKD